MLCQTIKKIHLNQHNFDDPIPPISGIGYHWQLQKTPFPGILGEIFPRLRPKHTPPPPFPRKWEYACILPDFITNKLCPLSLLLDYREQE